MKRLFNICLISMVAIVVALPLVNHASADSFNQNNIIDDGVFDNASSMSASQIDNWLNANFPSSCISTNNHFSSPDPTGYNPTNGFLYGGNVSAGRVIYDSAQAYGINPQVLIATLEKESSVVSGAASYHCTYINTAMGYGCPDSGSCPTDPATMSGFSKQVIHAAWLLKFGEQRSEGNTGWAVIKGNWDNSDDPETCYGGPMTQGTFRRCSSGAAAYYDGYTTIDSTAVHMDDGATAALYWYTPHFHGNQLFFNIFTDWFGTTRSTPFFKVDSSPNVYIFGGNNNYYRVTSAQELADYGYGTAFLSISTSSTSGLTNGGDLPPVANFAGGSEIYAWIGGGIHWLPDETTFTAFGYSFSHVANLPAWVQAKVVRGGDMHQVVKRQGTSDIFYVQSGKRSHISSNQAYTTLGSPVYSSRASVTLAPSYVNSLPVGPPIMTAGTFAKASDTGAYGIWNGTNYQTMNTNAAKDTGIAPNYTTSSTALNQLTANPTPLNKLAKNSGGTTYILDNKKKLTVSAGQLANLGFSSGDFVTTNDTFLAKFTTTANMQTLIRINSGSAVYDIISGHLYHIFSGDDFTGLGYSFSNVATVNQTTANLFTNNGADEFKQGRLVQVSGSPQVYLIEGTFAKKYIPSMQVFNEYGFSGSSVVTVSNSDLSAYSTSGNLTEVVKDGSTNYWLVNSGVRHQISGTMMGASYYNIDSSSVPLLSNTALSRLTVSSALTQYIQAPHDSKVYGVSDGQKHWFTSASAFTNAGGTWDGIVQLSAAYINELPTGSPIN